MVRLQQLLRGAYDIGGGDLHAYVSERPSNHPINNKFHLQQQEHHCNITATATTWHHPKRTQLEQRHAARQL
jgi:hypothetical protein